MPVSSDSRGNSVFHGDVNSPGRSLTSSPGSASRLGRAASWHERPNLDSRFPSFHALSETPVSTVPSSPRIKPRLQKKRSVTMSIPGQTFTKLNQSSSASSVEYADDKLVVVMVGLPARGKSYIVNKLVRYYNWLQYSCKAFNAGNLRRKQQAHDSSAAFFDPTVPANARLLDEYASQTLEALIHWLQHENGIVGIFDATNSTLERRKSIVERLQDLPYVTVLFIESVCSDEQLLASNMMLKLRGPDYKGKDPQQSLLDFQNRVRMYEKKYEPLGEKEENLNYRYIKVINVGKKVVAYNIQGFLTGQAVFFLLNFNLSPRQIWLTRHGESEDNVKGRIGGDAPLTPLGLQFREDLAKFIAEQRILFQERLHIAQLQKSDMLQGAAIAAGESSETAATAATSVVAAAAVPSDDFTSDPDHDHDQSNSCYDDGFLKPFSVWSSMMKRSLQTAAAFDEDAYDVKAMKMLDEICSGMCEGMTYKEIRTQYPAEYEARKHDKLQYRYPGSGGESYLDVIYRLQSVIVEIERLQHHVLIIGHRVIMRIILAYFLGCGREDIAYLNVPLHTVYCIEPRPYGTDTYQYNYDPVNRRFVQVPFSVVNKAHDAFEEL
ncbi:6-phosphofructo-2-kinase [Schizosaccharomyces japonicus yFS275]|uniref:6-phosphofructo-2-kinase n=1 Tax=Schizosaccharomyces japonicus (strain yFS275 / FY16936) TaxID=402676 RepID=B6K3Y9_SCHJY|nr:6-phosphofructo-2-kinase [Schizosaccharomyces japonicus yFS275]EEB08196.1 6-phosphofructo-2-kinase [Schizosaccharomyces japonicus yFS275]